MTGPRCKSSKGKKPRKHTPIVSGAQRGAMGAAYRAKKTGSTKGLKGPAKQMAASMPEWELKAHLEESKGKKLPKRTRRKR